MYVTNLLDLEMEVYDLKYKRFVNFAHDVFWQMAHFCANFSERWDLQTYGIAQRVFFTIQKEMPEKWQKGLFEYFLYEDDLSDADAFSIAIWDRPKAFKQMEKAIIHELTHLFMVKTFRHIEIHDWMFWDFLRRFKRFYSKSLKERNLN